MTASLPSEAGKARVDGGGLAAAGRAREQQETRTPAKKSFQLIGRRRRHTQVRQPAHRGSLKQTQHDLFARHGWISRHAHIVARTQVRMVNAAVLRHRFLVSLESGEEL